MLFSPAWTVAQVWELGIWGGRKITHIVIASSSSTINCVLLRALRALCVSMCQTDFPLPAPRHSPRVCQLLSSENTSLRQTGGEMRGRRGKESSRSSGPGRALAGACKTPFPPWTKGGGGQLLCSDQPRAGRDDDPRRGGRKWRGCRCVSGPLVMQQLLLSLRLHVFRGPQTTRAAKHRCFPYQLFRFLLRMQSK